MSSESLKAPEVAPAWDDGQASPLGGRRFRKSRIAIASGRIGNRFAVRPSRMACALLLGNAGSWLLQPVTLWLRRLSMRLRAVVQGRGRAHRDASAENRLSERQPHLARVVGGEGGKWDAVLAFAAKLKLKVIEPLQLRYSIAGIDGLPESPLVEHDAFYDADTGELFVAEHAGSGRWAAIADAVKQTLLPNSGPAAKLALRTVLQATDADTADSQLDELGYAPLADETWEEFQRVARERAAEATENDEADASDADEDEANHDDEASEDDQASQDEDVADAGGDEDEDEEQADDDEDEAGEYKNGTGEDGDEVGEDENDENRAAAAGDSRAGTGGQTGSGQRHAGGGRGRGRGGSGSDRAGSGGHGGRRRGASRGGGHRNPDRRLISYVSTATDDSSASGTDSSSPGRDAIGEAGVDLVVKHLVQELADEGLTVQKMPDGQKGYDVLVRDADDNPVRYVEVKTVTDRWGDQGVGLSRAQYELADDDRERFWLYVVEHVYDPDARIFAINDPAGQIGQFFFDRGWQAVAETKTWVPGARPPQPA
jgi:hypothetical protein